MPTAVVTGSSSGIGAATALALAKRGYHVLLHAHRNVSGLNATAERIRKCASHTGCGTFVRCVTADISQAAARQSLMQAAFHWRGTVDVWVNNAGADVLTGNARSASFEQRLERLWQVDVAGTIHLSRMVAARMAVVASKQQPVNTKQQLPSEQSEQLLPTIINIGWDQAPLGMEGEAGELFCPIKGAVMAFTRALALTAGPLVRVNCVAPGWIRTSWGSEAASPYWNQRATQEAALERWGTPEDVAETIAWLAGPESKFINGQTIEVNGGRRFYPGLQDSIYQRVSN